MRSLYESIRKGSKVTIHDGRGHQYTGKAIMHTPAKGWRIELDASHRLSPASKKTLIATPDNVVGVSYG